VELPFEEVHKRKNNGPGEGVIVHATLEPRKRARARLRSKLNQNALLNTGKQRVGSRSKKGGRGCLWLGGVSLEDANEGVKGKEKGPEQWKRRWKVEVWEKTSHPGAQKIFAFQPGEKKS